MPFTADELAALLKARLPAQMPLEIPPQCMLDMQAEPLEYEDGKRLSIRFPVLPRYRNPMGNMQGGFIVAALDNTLGPFSYLIAPPSVTAQLNVSYLRPVLQTETAITCTAWLTARTGKTLYLAGEVVGSDGKTVALCQSVCQLVG
jgi:uncharacterized protein (TIGR00369 family)